MSPKTTPMAARTSGVIGRRPACAATRPSFRGGEPCSACILVRPPRETDVELLELPVEVRPLQARALGHAAHVALLLAEQLLEIDALERLARFAQRQLEEARRELGRDGGRGEEGALAEEPPHVLSRDLAVDRQREVGDDAVQV